MILNVPFGKVGFEPTCFRFQGEREKPDFPISREGHSKINIQFSNNTTSQNGRPAGRSCLSESDSHVTHPDHPPQWSRHYFMPTGRLKSGSRE